MAKMGAKGPLMNFTLISDTKAMTRSLNDVQRRIVPQVTMRALNTALSRYHTAAARSIAKSVGLRVGLVKARLRPKKAHRNDLRARLTALLLRVLARHLGDPKETKSGAKAGKFQFPGAFVATMKSGKELVMKRVQRSRLPIQEQGVPLNPPAQQVLRRELTNTATPAFLKEFQRLLALKLQR